MRLLNGGFVMKRRLLSRDSVCRDWAQGFDGGPGSARPDPTQRVPRYPGTPAPRHAGTPPRTLFFKGNGVLVGRDPQACAMGLTSYARYAGFGLCPIGERLRFLGQVRPPLRGWGIFCAGFPGLRCAASWAILDGSLGSEIGGRRAPYRLLRDSQSPVILAN